MSRWGGFYASFQKPKDGLSKYFTMDRLISGVDPRRSPPPLGSEAGYHTHITEHEEYDDGSGNCINVSVRIRDIRPYVDTYQCIAWFTAICDQWNFPSAELEFEIDDGPRYSFVWRDKKLIRNVGPLDFI